MSQESADQRHLAAIMFTDIVGYSALTQRNEDMALSLLREHNRIIRAALPVHRGKEIKTVGDAFLVEFASALDAVRCAIAIQHALHDRNTATGDEAIHVRIGIHLGDVVYRDGDVFGDGVNIASRIQSLAEAGGICISQDVARQVQNKLDVALHNLGRGLLKNIVLPVDVYAVQMPWSAGIMVDKTASLSARRRIPIMAVAGVSMVIAIAGGWWYLGARSDAATKAVAVAPERAKSIAVLPFTNLGGNKDDDYFGDGITEDLLTQLAQISELKVISRTSVMQYKGTKKSMREIARELGVAHILEGSVRRGDKQFRINAQLIDAERDEHLWAKTYDRDIRDILAVQSEVTREISTSLKARLLASETAQIDKHAQGNADAYVLYLKGLYAVQPSADTDPNKFEPAAEYFRQVIALDANSPLGYIGMARYHIQKARRGIAALENYADSEKFVLKALAVDNSSAEAYIMLALLRGLGQWNWKEAELAAKRAIELNPGNSEAWDTYRAMYLEPTGRLEEAVVAQKRAISLDPRNSLLGLRLANLYKELGQCDEAIRQARLNATNEPAVPIHLTVAASCFEQQGKFKEAIAANRQVKMYWVTDALLDTLDKAYAKEGGQGYFRALRSHQISLAAKRNDAFVPRGRFGRFVGFFHDHLLTVVGELLSADFFDAARWRANVGFAENWRPPAKDR